ncbi:hypothetical protein GCM10010289_72630 [Streptomyces violascens]|nr:hypothetical protein GCM10010289_72630 [Streptomyces violascens]
MVVTAVLDLQAGEVGVGPDTEVAAAARYGLRGARGGEDGAEGQETGGEGIVKRLRAVDFMAVRFLSWAAVVRLRGGGTWLW